MKIRQLIAQDAHQYLNMRLEALQNNPEAFASSYQEEKNQSVDKYINRFKSPQDSFTFGAFYGYELIGVVTLVKEKRVKLWHKTSIVAMYVTKEKRGYGIGKALLVEAIQKARDLRVIEQVYLTVVTTNSSAKRLYSSFGFKVFGTEKNALKYNDTYFDEYHMVLFL
ncbi:GNAT family N-acetyltransferase [Virgibacillus profundi]|uniref:GNAT family N-acetyltransferase n=1 Tax=Virgibacillus profundi TaxID=2024555 RepID=A0A2A2IIN7_9BACI|nr:N-acetyltransferase [Virgibacillus profundi]PAV31497.1 GNAT family N-acetyltransferase [Virgibacillus profundi]PXY55683.1 N-acetyltransferase [Virgibacillus profundi]